MVLIRDGAADPRIADPALPATRSEYITVVAHYHRAEIARMAGWRDRIDRTTNWAITLTAAMLSLTFSAPTAHHSVLLFGMVMMFLLVSIESRRYRFFDVYRRRVRSMERNYYAQVFNPTVQIAPHWARALGDDLQRPTFVISQSQAMSRRLKRNYIWMFLILLAAWLLKISTGTAPAIGTATEQIGAHRAWYAGADLGQVPGFVTVILVGAFYLWLAHTAYLRYRGRSDGDDGVVHV